MEGFWCRLRSLLTQSRSVSSSVLAVLLIYSFSSQFLPIEPYLVPYLTSVKHFTNFQVTVDIYPCSIYAQLIFTLVMAPACFYLSYKLVIVLDNIWIWHGCTLGLLLIYFSSCTGRGIPNHGQLLAIEKASYATFFILSLISLGICCAVTILLPKDCSSSPLYPSLTAFWSQDEGWLRILKETWDGKNIQILSLWWALAYAGFSLVQNYGTSLFDAIDSKSNLNGHILAVSQAAGSLGSLGAVYLELFAIKSGMFIYVLGSALMAIVCACMGFSMKIWVAYLMYVMISGIYQTLACLVSVRCSRLLSNRQFILLFSVNNFAGLLVETLLQAALEILGLSVSAQFISFAGFFFLTTAIFAVCCFIGNGDGDGGSKIVSLASEGETEPLISESL
ncbi:uncharacterized protein LOC131220824 isoform X2 [Magnolia sinica]|uniref:uncharacterized protein LOC131220824 isoform X2 n=1 Tax=Magnolia sinica TaxID=86752 RepID=UPI0026584C15|nr:uncharacterized protein LOC131220824 isoform X2 [Magnolia sinica]